jgi:ABC-type glycerol-3-phosphate transport system substrate-binding protein
MFNIRPFQIVLIGGFAALAILGLIFFSVYQSSVDRDERSYGARVVIWGTLPRDAFRTVFNEVTANDKDFQVVEYVEKDLRTFDLELLTAIAEGRSPDLIVLRSDAIVAHRGKLRGISYETVPERTFKDTYIDGAEIYLLSDGVYGLPFAVDPMVMYWNRDIFSSSGLATPPRTWEELVAITEPAITEVDASLGITRSALGFGEYANIRNAKNILSLLFLQSGTEIVTEAKDGYQITLEETRRGGIPPADASLSFYTQFANPAGTEYTWNRALPQDRQEFASGDLALYFGLGSEYRAIDAANPNLNFDVTQVPQGSGATIKRGFGAFYAFAIPRASGNAQGAWQAARVLSGQATSAALAEYLDLAPVHRSEIGKGSSDPYRQTLYTAALTARAWLDPDPAGSENVFKTMIEDVTSGRTRVSDAVDDAVDRLQLLFK